MADTWLHAVLGGVATLVLAPVLPFAPVLGGGIAGYLEAEEGCSDGLRVGAYAGAFAFVSLLALAVFFGGLLFAVVTGVVGGPPPFVSGAGVLLLVIGAVFGAIYVVGLSALGGLLGVYVHREL
jgi:hypothetical protein